MAIPQAIKSLSSVGAANPTGMILAFMGTIVLEGYLSCDGTEYNIVDYSDLANYFEDQFGAKEYFGGDGVDTFAVPDLQGEFLRGTGTNSHANQGSGGNVGEHQNSTEIPTIGMNTQGLVFGNTYNKTYFTGANKDSTVTARTGYATGGSYTASAGGDYKYMIRPTNTSVLYCIKY